MNNTINSQDQEAKILHREEEDEEEEALSLCDFPLNRDESEKKDSSRTHHHRRSSSQPWDSFEFSNDLNFENMSHAEDIISGGKLVPYKQRQQQQQQQQQSLFDEYQILKSSSDDYDCIDLSRRYCDSLPTRSNSTSSAGVMMRSSRSLDSKKLRRNSSLVMKSEASDIHRRFSKGLVKGSKPRWYGLMFGLVKFPPEMDLQDMKNRQFHRNPGSIFPAAEDGGRAPANRRSSWGHDLLRVLSCKNHPSTVAVTSSIHLVPQV